MERMPVVNGLEIVGAHPEADGIELEYTMKALLSDLLIHTIGEMKGGVLPGEGAKIFETDFGRIGVIICFDLNFQELLADHKNQGVELLCMLSASA